MGQRFTVVELFQRRFDKRQRSTDVVRRVDKEANLVIGYLSLLAQHDNTQRDARKGYKNERIQQQRPYAEPDGLLDDDIHAAFFQDDAPVFIGYGADAQGVLTGVQIGEADDILLSGAAPAVIEPFQLPRVQDEGRIVVVDGRNLKRKYVLIVFQFQAFRLVNVQHQGRAFVFGIYRLVENAQVAEYHARTVLAGQYHISWKFYGAVGASENDVSILAQGSRTGIEVVGMQSLFFGPVMENLLFGIETAQPLFGA